MGVLVSIVSLKNTTKTRNFWHFAGTQVRQLSDHVEALARVKFEGYTLTLGVSLVFLLTSFGYVWHHALFSSVALIVLGLISFSIFRCRIIEKNNPIFGAERLNGSYKKFSPAGRN